MISHHNGSQRSYRDKERLPLKPLKETLADSESDEDFSEPAESDEEEFTVKKVSQSKKEKVTNHEKTNNNQSETI
ncbi:hypothetical protein CesoFtcFv8_004298 [Champsocephalus esox]|uniref:Uncharacterized protein n=1 Tax=Champsocephalus esox TaxID=159716 RepID=A0AAN8CU59_9TELE|nr:hypothetical protein CesoFtcFv8_004298 [Champsocephalus esox]